MGRSSAAGRGHPLTLLLALVLLVACGEQSKIDPDAPVSVAGAFRDTDGSPLVDRPVRLGSGVTTAEAGFGVLTVGLSCLGGGCTGDSFDTTTADDGTFELALEGRDTRSSFGEATSLLLSTSAPPPADRPSGAAISARFRVQTTDVDLPVLTLADVRPSLEAGAGGTVTARWDGSAAPAPYTLTYLGTAGERVWETSVTEARADVDGRVLEDVTGLATVTTSRADAIEGSTLEVTSRSSGVAFRGGFGPAPSRGSGCEIRSDAGAVQPLDACPVTDADLTPAVLSPVVCPTGSGDASTTACLPADRVRIVLDQQVAGQLVVVRGCTDPCRVEGIGPGDEVMGAGPVASPFGAATLDGRPLRAVDVISADLSTLAEVSVWPAVQGDQPLLPVRDPEQLVDGAAEDDGASGPITARAALAVLAVVAAFSVLGFVIGRRTRSSR